MFRQKKLAQVRSDFVSNMTHEFKTPITTIVLASEMLCDRAVTGDADFNSPVAGLAKTIDAQAKRLSQMMEQLLQMALFENMKLSFRFRPIDVNSLINKVIDGFMLQVAEKNGQIATHLDAAQPMVLADELHLSNVISNLIDNAFKYSSAAPVITISTRNGNIPLKGSTIPIWETKAESANTLIISVSDNGIGIADADRQRIFDQFFRVHTGNLHNVKGFGLGLSYVKKIVEAHKGTVIVESKPGKGSTFIIRMPTVMQL
jgi:two-component system phosphate regulon sensor histidine kinase PhoR